MALVGIPLFCLIFAVVTVENKKYDVEQEAQKLYGQNLALVLGRFRKSADYLKILTEKTKALHAELQEVFEQIWRYYQSKIKADVTECLGINTLTSTEGPTSPGFRSKKKAGRRQDVTTEVNAETQRKIDRIDTYDKLVSVLTVKERNDFKDLGFKYIRDSIHMLIEKMGVEGDNGEVKMTRMGGQDGLRISTTTEHARDHRVTKEPKTEALAAVDSTEDRTLRRQT